MAGHLGDHPELLHKANKKGVRRLPAGSASASACDDDDDGVPLRFVAPERASWQHQLQTTAGEIHQWDGEAFSPQAVRPLWGPGGELEHLSPVKVVVDTG